MKIFIVFVTLLILNVTLYAVNEQIFHNGIKVTTINSQTFPAADGSASQLLQTDGAGTLSWEDPPVTGVTSISTGSGLTGGPITSTGTISVGTNAITPTHLLNVQALGTNICMGEYSAIAGTYDIAIGRAATTSLNGIAIGGNLGHPTNKTIAAENAVALGVWANASQTNSVAIGYNAETTAANQIRLGTATETVSIPGSLELVDMTFPDADGSANYVMTTDGAGTLSWSSAASAGVTSISTGSGLTGGVITSTGTISVGVNAITPTHILNIQALGDDIEIGAGATSSGGYAISIGKESSAATETSLAIGYQANADAEGSTVALGGHATATGNDSTALGGYATATDISSTALGQGATTTDDYQIMLGTGAHSVVIPGTIAGLTVNDYTFPNSDGATDYYLKTDGAGTLSWGDGTATPAANYASSSECDQSTQSHSYVDITNSSLSITTTGRPVLIKVMSAGSGKTAIWSVYASGAEKTFEGWVQLLKDSTPIAEFRLGHTRTGTISNGFFMFPGSSISHVDIPSAATYTYKLKFYISNSDDANATIAVNDAILFAVEL